ncbi:MAG: hypothetical protein AAB632_02530 [Patescibacteria group bacterium]
MIKVVAWVSVVVLSIWICKDEIVEIVDDFIEIGEEEPGEPENHRYLNYSCGFTVTSG